MQALHDRGRYGPDLALQIESMGATAVAIANRWILGWPLRVNALLAAGRLPSTLRTQTELEKDVLSEAVGMRHLSTIEILQIHHVELAPPIV